MSDEQPSIMDQSKVASTLRIPSAMSQAKVELTTRLPSLLDKHPPTFRQRPPEATAVRMEPVPVQGTDRNIGWCDQFRLMYGDGGAKVHRGWLEWYVTRIEFEKKFLYDSNGNLIDDVNSLKEQAAIEGVQVMEISGSGSSGGSDDEVLTPLDPWKQLDWFGDVWAVIELNAETGEPVALTIEGPDKPDMQPIPLLNDDLSRGSGSDSGSGARFGYSVLIGNCTEGVVIDQRHVGPLQWYLAFIPEAENSSSGSSGSSGGSSSAGSSAGSGSGSGSSKDTAIVFTSWGYRKWYAMESTEVVFFDFLEYVVPRGVSRFRIDPVTLEGMEVGTIRAFISPERGNARVRVEGEKVVVHARHWPFPATQRVQVMLHGIRRGFKGIRNAPATYEQFIDNECRLNPRMTREEVINKWEHVRKQ